MRKYIVEYLGTFFLVLSIVLTVNGGMTMAPVIIGLFLAGLIYGGYRISGAHYNPAVTLTIIMLGKINKNEVVGYVFAQILGALSASLVGTFLFGMGAPQPVVNMSIIPGFLAEILGTFILCTVILNTAASDRTAGNYYYGLAIGITVILISWGLGSWSGGAFNPAVAAGMQVAGMVTLPSILIIIIANLTGAVFAALLFKKTSW